MNRCKKVVLLGLALVLPLHASPSLASEARYCRMIDAGAAVQSLVLRNPGRQAVTFNLSFQPATADAGTAPLACGSRSLEAGQSSPILRMADLCPGLDPAQVGVLQACAQPVARTAPRGASSGDLLDDMMGNNLAIGAR